MANQLAALSIRGPNFARAAQGAASVSGALQNNQLNQLRFNEAQSAINRRNRVSELAPSVIAGDPGALGQVAAEDPAAAAQLQQLITTADTQKRAKVKATNDRIARAAMGATTPEAWDAANQQLISEGVIQAPVPFEQRDAVIQKAMTITQMLAQTKPMSAAGKLQDDLRQGRITQEQFDAEIRRKNKPLVSVNNNNNQETAYNKQRGKDFATMAGDIDKGGRAATSKIASLDSMEAALSNPNVYTGAGGEEVTKIKRVAQSLGFEVEGVAASEVVASVGNQMALELRNPAGGAGMPGAMSDKDREFLVSMVPGLAKPVKVTPC